MILSLQRDNLRVERYQMASSPNAFLGNAEVMKLVREKQMDALPIIIVRGKVIKVGAYPTMDEVRVALSLIPNPSPSGGREPSPLPLGEG
jgi:hypothetical protein